MKKSAENKIPIQHYSEPHYFENAKELFSLKGIAYGGFTGQVPTCIQRPSSCFVNIGKTGILGGSAWPLIRM